MSSLSVASSLRVVASPLVDLNTNYGENTSQLLSYGVGVINDEILNVLTTQVGEEQEEPEYGSKVPVRVFDPITNLTCWKLEHDVSDALGRWVPQIVVNQALTRVTPLPAQRLFDFTITYSVRGVGYVSAYSVKLGPYGSRPTGSLF